MRRDVLQARRAALLAGPGSSGHSPSSFKASRMGPSRELSSGQSLGGGSGSDGRLSLASEMASMAVDQQATTFPCPPMLNCFDPAICGCCLSLHYV